MVRTQGPQHHQPRPGDAECPRCGAAGRVVRDETISAILQDAAAAQLLPVERRFCATPNCSVLYYGVDGTVIEKGEANVRVGVKETEDPLPLCYCFGFTRADVLRELAETGSCGIPGRIEASIRASGCECVRRNPSGACCLGEVRKVVEEATGARDLEHPATDRKPDQDLQAAEVAASNSDSCSGSHYRSCVSIDRTRSSSSQVVVRPRLKRTAPIPSRGGVPMAARTGESSTEPAWQAEPVDAATPVRAASTSAPTRPTKLTLEVFGPLGCDSVDGYPIPELLKELPLEAVLQFANGAHADPLSGELTRSAQRDIEEDILGSPAATLLVACAVDERLDGCPTPDVQSPNAPRRVTLVARDRKQIDAEVVHARIVVAGGFVIASSARVRFRPSLKRYEA